MCVESAKLADFSKISLVNMRVFCKAHSVRGVRFVMCAEVPTNMVEMPNEQGAALIKITIHLLLKMKDRESENVIQITGRKNPKTQPISQHRESQVLLVCAV